MKKSPPLLQAKMQTFTRLISSGLLIAVINTPNIAVALKVEKVPSPRLSQGSWITDMANVLSPETETETEDSYRRNIDLQLSLFLLGLVSIVVAIAIIHDWYKSVRKTQHSLDEQPKHLKSENSSKKDIKPRSIPTQPWTESATDIFEVEEVVNLRDNYYNHDSSSNSDCGSSNDSSNSHDNSSSNDCGSSYDSSS